MENQLTSGYQFLNILLVKSNFEQNLNVVIPHNEIGDLVQNLHIDIQVASQNDVIQVTEKAIFSITFKEQTIAEFDVQFMGIFQKVGEPSLDSETFGKINAAAIIFPFVREQIASIALKAGRGAILLPPINFVEKANTGK